MLVLLSYLAGYTLYDFTSSVDDIARSKNTDVYKYKIASFFVAGGVSLLIYAFVLLCHVKPIVSRRVEFLLLLLGAMIQFALVVNEGLELSVKDPKPFPNFPPFDTLNQKQDTWYNMLLADTIIALVLGVIPSFYVAAIKATEGGKEEHMTVPANEGGYRGF